MVPGIAVQLARSGRIDLDVGVVTRIRSAVLDVVPGLEDNGQIPAGT